MFSSVIDTHVYVTGHTNPEHYVDLLKKQFSEPDTVVQSKKDKNSKIANLKLIGERHDYLHVVVKYGRLFNNKNYIATFYGENYPKKGKELWKKTK